MPSLFQTLSSEASNAGITRRTRESRDWFMKRLKTITNVPSSSILRDPALIEKSKPLPGRMFQFIYDPKLKKTLPYYDKFPLMIMVGPAEGGFYGLNLHYLSPRLRAVFMDRLMEYASNKNLNENTRLAMSYQMLKNASKLKPFGPCFKKYLNAHVRSTMVMIPATEWEIACFLPSQSFKGASSESIWDDSKVSTGL